MKITVIINNLISCGAERLVLDQVHEMLKRGISVTLITLRPEKEGNSFMPECRLPRERVRHAYFGSLFDVAAWITLVSILRQERPDIVMTHLWFANTIGRIAAHCAGVPVVSFEHNVYDSVKTWKQFSIDRILQYGTKKIIAVSDAVRDSLIRHGIAPSRIAVVPNGVDLSRYTDAKPTRVAGTLAFTYLFVGRLVRQKGVDVLLDAFSRLPYGNLLIVGDGIDRALLEAQARSLAISDRVIFLGVRQDVASLMKGSDCFVLPSRWEGLGIVLVEALASGCPVICSDFEAARSVVTDRVSALIVPREDAAALAEAMREIERNHELREGLKTEAGRAVKRFAIDTHIDTLIPYVR